MKDLDQDARGALRKHGIRFGQFTIFMPLLLKPAPTRLRLVLHSLWQDLQEFPEAPPPGLVTIPVIEAVDPAAYLLSGYRPAGQRAIRIDMLERLADQLRVEDSRSGFEAKPDMLSITGMTLEQFADLMSGLGYKAEQGERVKVKAEPPADSPAQTGAETPKETPVETPAETPAEQPAEAPQKRQRKFRPMPQAKHRWKRRVKRQVLQRPKWKPFTPSPGVGLIAVRVDVGRATVAKVGAAMVAIARSKGRASAKLRVASVAKVAVMAANRAAKLARAKAVNRSVTTNPRLTAPGHLLVTKRLIRTTRSQRFLR